MVQVPCSQLDPLNILEPVLVPELVLVLEMVPVPVPVPVPEPEPEPELVPAIATRELVAAPRATSLAMVPSRAPQGPAQPGRLGAQMQRPFRWQPRGS